MKVLNKGKKQQQKKDSYEARCDNCGFHAIDSTYNESSLILKCPTCKSDLIWKNYRMPSYNIF